MSDDFDYGDYIERLEQRPRDRVVDEAKAVLLEDFFPDEGKEVYYGRQLEVWLEKRFFHWITKKALNELVQERAINFSEETAGHHKAHFYWSLRHRYARAAEGLH
jgi:hypothetical protein